MFRGRPFSIGVAAILSITLVLGTAISAFAAWNAYQNGPTNNGVISATNNGVPPITLPQTVKATGLLTNNPYGSVFSGVDNQTVMKTTSDVTTAYTVYNGGVYNAATGSGGARLATTDLATGAVKSIVLDPAANNVSQLSTPWLNTSNNTLYAATTYYIDCLNGAYSPTAIPSGSSTITATIDVPSDYWQPQLMFTFPTTYVNTGSFTATATLSNGGSTYTFGPGYFSESNGGYVYTAYYNEGTLIPKGTAASGNAYTLTITISNTTGVSLSANVQFLVSAWHLWSVDVSGTPDTPTTPIASGYGQVNTPLEYYTSGYWLSFGVYEGDRSYYIYWITNNNFTRFNAQDDFYWAGSYSQRLTSNGQVIFGGDSGKIYVQDATNFSAITTTPINIGAIAGVTDVGRIRSTIMNGGNGYLYFTSTGSSSHGYLWSIQLSTILSGSPVVNATQIPAAQGNTMSSVSTPVLSTNNILYVGTSQYDSSFNGVGQVLAYNLTSSSIPASSTVVYTGDSVSASPIVYSAGTGQNRYDYIYFTTNASNGKGYCYSYRITTAAVASRWSAGGTSGNRYSLQGFSADGGYLVYGDDGNNLYIMK
jgi:hypothetical protein